VTEDFSAALTQLRGRGLRIFAAHLAGQDNYDRADYTGPCGILIGNEGRGLTEEAAALATDLIRIPMHGRIESLNAAMAAGILMYEADRQRRQADR
jgi:TrmH family RNA methyltransferase